MRGGEGRVREDSGEERVRGGKVRGGVGEGIHRQVREGGQVRVDRWALLYLDRKQKSTTGRNFLYEESRKS